MQVENLRVVAEQERAKNENVRIQNEKDRQENTADAISKAKEATELLINQVNTIAFRINPDDNGLDAIILSA